MDRKIRYGNRSPSGHHLYNKYKAAGYYSINNVLVKNNPRWVQAKKEVVTKISKQNKKCIPKKKTKTFFLVDCVFCNKIRGNELQLLNHIIMCKHRMIHDEVITGISGNKEHGDGTGDGGGNCSTNDLGGDGGGGGCDGDGDGETGNGTTPLIVTNIPQVIIYGSLNLNACNCKLFSYNLKSSRCHYHCPYCNTSKLKWDMIKHIKSCNSPSTPIDGRNLFARNCRRKVFLEHR